MEGYVAVLSIGYMCVLVRAGCRDVVIRRVGPGMGGG